MSSLLLRDGLVRVGVAGADDAGDGEECTGQGFEKGEDEGV